MTVETKSTTRQYGFWESVLASVVISLSIFFLFHYFFSLPQESVNPPILIVDYAEIIGDLPVDEVESDVVMMRVGEVIAKFHDAGFLIIEAQNVISAPNSLYLTKEMINE